MVSWRERAAVGLLALLALHPLLGSGFLLGHDAGYYAVRVVEFRESLAAGLLPFWADHLSRGHGQPTFGFAPPLVYALGAPLLALGLGVARAVQWPAFALALLGALALQAWLRTWVEPRPALVGVAAFLFAPYQQVDLYVRGAYAEAAAMALLPVCLLAVDRAIGGPGAVAAGTVALASAAVVLAHPPGAILAFAVTATLAIAGALAVRRLAGLTTCLAGLATGLLLSAFFWLPALAEKDLVRTDLLVSERLSYADHFLAWRQLLWGRWGFGHSLPGGEDGMAFYLGPAHLLLAVAGVAATWRRPEPLVRAYGLAAAATSLVAVGLTLSWSAPLWQALPLLPYFGYPWRLLLVPAVMLALLAGLGAPGPRQSLLAIALLVALNLRHAGAWGSQILPADAANPEALAAAGRKASLFDEYEPRTAAAGLAYDPLVLRAEPPSARVRVLHRHPEQLRVEVTAAEPVRLTARLFDYPGWRLTVDGRPAEHRRDPAGRIAFDLPAGRHEARLELGPTPARALGRRLSAGTALLLTAGLVLLPLARRRSPAGARSCC